jgi:hypothetical protein
VYNIEAKLKEVANNPHFQTPEAISDYVAQLELWNKEAEARLEKLDDTKVIATKWYAKPELTKAKTWSHYGGHTGGWINDYESLSRIFITVGTEKQEALLMRSYKQLYLQNNKQAVLINLK